MKDGGFTLFVPKGFVIDLDGTLYRGKDSIPGSAAFMEWLRLTHYPYLLATNCPSRTPEQIVKKLLGFQIRTNTEHIITSGILAAHYLCQKGYRRVFLVGEQAVRQALDAEGLTVTDEDPECVLISWDRNFCYQTLNLALWHLHTGIPLFCTNPDRTIPHENTVIAHTAPICAAIESASGRTAHYLGKPGFEMAELAVSKLGIAACELCVVGDNPDTDIAFADRNGMQSVLLSSERYTLSSSRISVKPGRIVRSLVELIS